MKTMILPVVLAVALMLAGCGGGSKGGAGAGSPSVQTPTTPTPQTPTTPRPTVRVVPLVPGERETPTVVVEIPDNTVRITPGQTREMSVGGRSVSVRCPSGGVSCHVGVHEGSLWYRLDGAVPFALASLPSTPTPPTPAAGNLPVVEDFLAPLGGGGGNIDLWEGPGSSLVLLDPDTIMRSGLRAGHGQRGPILFQYEFVTEPLSFIGTYEGRSYLQYDGRDFVFTGTASMQYDGSDGLIDVTVNIPGEFQYTFKDMKQFSTNPSGPSGGASTYWEHEDMIVKGDQYGYYFNGTTFYDGKNWQSFIGFTSGSSAGGYFSMGAGEEHPSRAVGTGKVDRGTSGRGVWGVSYSGSSRTPAPELSSSCYTVEHPGSYYCP